MKQHTIDTGTCTILLVELPEGSDKATHLSFNERGTLVFFTEQPDAPPMEQGLYKLNVGSNWKHLCPASEMTEEQMKGITDQSAHTGLFAHYIEGVKPVNVYCYKSALESWDSLLRANDIDWKTWDKQRTHIFIKQD